MAELTGGILYPVHPDCKSERNHINILGIFYFLHKKELFSALFAHSCKLFDLLGFSLQSTAPEVAKGVLEDVGPLHLKNMGIMGQKKPGRADASWSHQKTPSKNLKK